LHVMAFVPLQHISWGVGIGGDVDSETFEPISRLRLGLALIGLTALAGTWGATLIGTKLIVRPVHQLTREATEIARGDLQARLVINDGGEIGEMAAALEHMRQQLLNNITQLSDWNEQLEQKVSEQTDELKKQQRITRHLLHRTISAQEEERTRIARELHDEFGQTLIAIELGLASLTQYELADSANETLERSRQLTEHSISELRRMVNALRPGVLDQLGLVSSIAWVSRQLFAPLAISCQINSPEATLPLSDDEETVLFRIAQEAMHNIARHSKARHVDIALASENGHVKMLISDDGQGYEVEQALAAGPGQRLGLASIRERAALVDGTVTIQSQPSEGTVIEVKVPAARPCDE
ncbi:MAG: HAMP domain-containing protein, partial [Anaerolineales bacterium]|nr:HAMP domain-containing protein [Anaerolineales bacterium]